MSNLSNRVQAFNFKISKTNLRIIVEKNYFQKAPQHKAQGYQQNGLYSDSQHKVITGAERRQAEYCCASKIITCLFE